MAALVGPRNNVVRGLAAPASPPPPPTFIPTPIGPPPPPPTAVTTVTATPAVSPTAGATATTQPSGQVIQFSLQAARVSRANNPGNMEGLAQVKRPSTVWLMMYYNVRSIPRALKRLTTYTVFHTGKVVYRVQFKGKTTLADMGKQLSRYAVYTVSPVLPFGRYTFRAVLTIGSRHETKNWAFRIARHERVAASSSSAQVFTSASYSRLSHED